MSKILLVGEVNGAIQLLQNELATTHQIQICVPEYKGLAGMIRIVRPDVVILFQNNTGEITKDILMGLRSDWPDVPVIVICPKEDREYFRTHCPLGQFHFLFKPVKKRVIDEKIEDIMAARNGRISSYDNLPEIEEPEEEEEDDGPIFKNPNGNIKYKILAVDDNPVVLRNIREMLGDDYNIYAASSGEKALDISKKVDIDLMLLDYEMPGMNGVETLKQFKQQIKTYKTPVVFLTAVADRGRIQEVISYQPAGYLLKPIEAKVLKDTIRKIFK